MNICLYINTLCSVCMGCPGSSAGKESACHAGDPGLIPELGRSPGEGISYPIQYSWVSLVAQMVKNPPAMQQTWVWFLGWEDPLQEGIATHSSFLAWKIPRQRSLAGYRPWGPKESDMTEWLSLGTITINRSLNYPWVCHFHPFTFNTSVYLEWTSCK